MLLSRNSSSGSSRSRIVTLCTLAIALIFATIPTMSAAHADSGSDGPLTLSIADKQPLKSGCGYYIYDFSIQIDMTSTPDIEPPHWNLDVQARNTDYPSGSGGSDFQYGYGDTQASGTVFLCDSLDGAGRYELEGTLTVDDTYDSNFDPIPTGGVYQATASGLLSIPTSVKIKTSHKRFSYKSASRKHPHRYKLTGKICSRYGCGGYCTRKCIQIEYRRNGTNTYKPIKLVPIPKSSQQFTAFITLKAPGRVRAVYLPNKFYLRGTSKATVLK